MVYVIYTLAITFSLGLIKLILGDYIPIPLGIVFLPLLPLLYIVISILKEWRNKIKEEQEKERQKDLKKEAQSKKKEIEKLYKKVKETEHKGVYDKKVFVIIDILNQLNEENLNGEFKNRVQVMINKSLKLYILNLKIATRMLEVSKLDLDFDKEIKMIVTQNREIIDRLKEVITKLVLIDTKEEEFGRLINNFEMSLRTLEIIKEKREEEL